MTTTTTRSAAPLDADALATLRANFSGELLVPGGPGYDEARRVWNGNVDRHPAVVARCHELDIWDNE